MVQREIKNKTKVYAATAILSAIILVSTIYTITSPTVLYSLTGISPMKTFASVDELKNFLTVNTVGGSTDTFAGGPLDAKRSNLGVTTTAPASTAGTEGALGSFGTQSDGYSTTNIQVAGVDEADTVKTDGNYIYTLTQDYAAESQNTIYIVKAGQDASVVGKIALGNSTTCAGMYLSANGNKLAVLGSNYGGLLYASRPVGGNMDIAIYGYYVNDVKTFIYVYDVSSKANPVLSRNLTLSGSYFNSRMINNYVYAVVSQPAYLNNDTVILPAVYNNAEGSEIKPTSIYYTDMQDSYFTYTSFTGVNVMDDSQAPSDMTVMMGGTSNMYVSPSNIYVTFPDKTGEGTEIFRVAINGASLSFEAKGVVPGYVLNQYSMDEYNGYFRIATTTSTGSWINRDEQNNLYVLNMDLSVVGKIENLAQGERIYSARFTGDKAYLVTFKQTDPFFVLDLKDPTAPKVAGELKIPGYSSYLHPYDENHVIGIGKENSTVKLSLFDVSDMNNPTEIAKYVIGQDADYSDSIALYEPKAFLFDYQKQLLVIPVSITNYGIVDIKPDAVPPVPPENGSTPRETGAGTSISSGSFGTSTYWQGAYVFKLSPANGFTLQGELSHQETPSTPYFYIYTNDGITRSLYIGNTLYTISNNRIQLNSLDTLDLVAKVNLP